MLVVPTADDVERFEDELTRDGVALIGARVCTFDRLFSLVGRALGTGGGRPVSEVQRRRLAALADAAIDGAAVASSTLRMATGLVLVLQGGLAFVTGAPRAEPSLPGRRAALVPVAFPVLLTPGLALLTVSGALEEKLVEPSTTLAVPPEITVADRTVGEAHDGGGGTKTVAQILDDAAGIRPAVRDPVDHRPDELLAVRLLVGARNAAHAQVPASASGAGAPAPRPTRSSKTRR